MSASIIPFSGEQTASDNLLIALLQYHHQQTRLIEAARSEMILLYRYLPEINLVGIVLDGLGIPPEGHKNKLGVFSREGFFDYPLQMIQQGTVKECLRVIHRIRRENAAIKVRGGQFINGTWVPPDER
ncbi:MAG: hypothetical protein GY807_21580 [Gammaproteobacteria bacterium]|nr:hypothetical protein [Gammaproteobacteria bacterium]